jgi:hypothetical protein
LHVPKTAAAKYPFPFVQTAFGTAFGFGKSPRKGCFNLSPTDRKIVIARRQRPDTMQLVRQYYDRLHLEQASLFDLTENGSIPWIFSVSNGFRYSASATIKK